jgi:hypothetical protein
MKIVERRLSGLRRRIYGVAVVRAIAWLISLPLLTILIAGWLDWRVHIPSIVRGSFLTLALCAAAYSAFRILVHCAWARLDLLGLALRIERYYPELNDALASAVEFMALDEKGKPCGSAAMRDEVARRAAGQISTLDLRRVAPARGLELPILALAATSFCAAAFAFANPANTFTAFWRFADPFGACAWPRQTRLVVQTTSRLARGQPVEIRARVSGVVPAQATVAFEGVSPAHQACDILQTPGGDFGTILVRRGRAEHSFRFQITANDAASEWTEVTVFPPPAFVALDGRPSPQLRLEYPAYTDLSPESLPDGFGNIDAVRGTRAIFTARTDRPIRRAWIEFQPEAPPVKPAALIGLLGPALPLGMLSLSAASRDLWDRTAVNVSADGRVLSVAFVPRVTGTYSVSLEDPSGLVGTRYFGLRVFADPAPSVWLDHPSRTMDRLELLPDAVIPMSVLVEDSIYGIRSVRLEYRLRGDGGPRSMALHEPGRREPSKPQFPDLPDESAGRSSSNVSRPTRLQLGRQLSLREIRHSDGSALKEGDVVVLQAVADDFDDVALDKQPGRSGDVEVLITGPPALGAFSSERPTQEQPRLTVKIETPKQAGPRASRQRDLAAERSAVAEGKEQQPGARSAERPPRITGPLAIQTQPGQGAKLGARREGEGSSSFPNLFKETWGHLPETPRQDMDQYSKEQFMAKYRALIEQYYATIAEKAHREGD